MKSASFKLCQYSGGVPHYAEVDLECAERSSGRDIRVGANAFAWLKEVYGPAAWEWPVCEGYRKAAIQGVEYALSHSSHAADSPIVITIQRIDASQTDTTDSSIAYAACYATWKALQLTPTSEPRFVGRHIVFPE